MSEPENVTSLPVPLATHLRLQRGNGGGGGEGLDVRLAKVEVHLERAQQDIAAITADTKTISERLARLEVKVDNLPTSGTILAIVLGSLTLLSAVIAFADQIRQVIAGSGNG